MNAFKTLLRNAKGASAVEYGLIAALIGLPAGIAFSSLGGELKRVFLEMADVISAAVT